MGCFCIRRTSHNSFYQAVVRQETENIYRGLSRAGDYRKTGMFRKIRWYCLTWGQSNPHLPILSTVVFPSRFQKQPVLGLHMFGA
jgi:hypothetical protein